MVQPVQDDAPSAVLMEPAGQGVHSVSPSLSAYLPAAHLSAAYAPEYDTAEPIGANVQLMEFVAGA